MPPLNKVADSPSHSPSNAHQNPVADVPLLIMAIPLFIEMVMTFIIPMVDVYFLSKVSDQAVTSLVSVMPVLLVGIGIMGAFQIAGIGVCSRLMGANKPTELAKSYLLYGGLMLALAICLSTLNFFGANLFTQLLTLSGDIQVDAEHYLRIWGGGLGLLVLYVCFASILVTQGKTIYIMISGILMNLVNLALDYLLIQGHGGFPALGVSGAAIAGVVAWFTADIAMAFFVFRRTSVRFALPVSLSEAKQLIKPLLRIALPGTVEPVSYQLAQIVIVTFVVSLGDISLAARAYLLNFFYLTYMWNMAIASAAQAKAANYSGLGNYLRATNEMYFALRVGLIGTFVIAFSIALFSQWLLGFYSNNAAITQLVITLLWVNILVELGRSANLILGGGLKACGDSLFVATNAIACMWLICVSLGYGLAFNAGLGLMGIWIAAALDENIRGLVDFFRWRSGKWNKDAMVECSHSPVHEPI